MRWYAMIYMLCYVIYVSNLIYYKFMYIRLNIGFSSYMYTCHSIKYTKGIGDYVDWYSQNCFQGQLYFVWRVVRVSLQR
jgi:hypothetical protein